MKKAVLITGASSGIGAATAKLFSQHGYFVYLLGRNEEHLTEVAIQCQHGASLLRCDLNSEASVIKYTQHLFERSDTDLQILVNNAGIFERANHTTEGGSLHSWRKQFDTNLFSAINITEKILPLFTKKKKGSIVNVSSTLGLKPSADTAAYSASKAAMINWTQSLAQELGPLQIRVNCVAPGIVDTPIHSFHNLSQDQKQNVISQLNPLQPLQRIGHVDEIAQAIYFLGSEQSSWTTGAVLAVDGGINLV